MTNVMTKYLLVTAACAVLMHAQQPWVVADTHGLHVTAETNAAHSTRLTIQNRAAVPLISFVFTGDGKPDGTSRICYEDTVQRFSWTAIAPGASRPSLETVSEQPHVVFRAALWADGSTYGEPEWIGRLQRRAPFARKELDIAISLLQDAAKEGRFNDAVLAKVQVALSQEQSEEETDNPTSARSNLQYILELAEGKIKRRPREDGSPVTDAEVIRSAIGHYQKWRDALSVYQ